MSSLLPVPGMGLCQGKFDAFLKGETDEAFRRPLPIALALDAVSLEKNKGKEEKVEAHPRRFGALFQTSL